MIHVSLPLQPKLKAPAESLFTPLSIQQSSGIRILSLTTMNADPSESEAYKTLVLQKIAPFDGFFKDADPSFLLYLQHRVPALKTTVHPQVVTTCTCKMFEEISGIRMYNQRRVQEHVCTYCETPLFEEEIEVLSLSLDNTLPFISENQQWVKNDLTSFRERNNGVRYKISKESGPIKIKLGTKVFGLKHQVVWAYGLVYLSNLWGKKDITLHFVHRVSSQAFLCGLLAKTIEPSLQIHLKGLPCVWLDTKKSISEITKEDIGKMTKGFLTSRKELRV